MKTKKYITPKIEVIVIETEDVISASGAPNRGDSLWGSGNGLGRSSSSSSQTRTNFYDRYEK